MSALLLALMCGVCVEDKVAATYDHAVVARALAQQRVVVFAEPRASIDAKTLKALAARAARAPGVEAATVKTSESPASVSFVLDPRRADARKTVAALQLDLLKVIDAPTVK
jgi:hypothetical protein